jgi:penicillin-binding protein 1A
MLKKLILIGVLLAIPVLLGAAGFLTWGYYYVSRDLPRVDTIEDYRPSAVSQVYASDGTLIAEFYDERRYPAKIREIPLYVRQAFLAAEDASFYSHPGIDVFSILRAFIKNMRKGSVKQGGSTITQQVVKNLLLSSERKIIRKVKEAILSYRIEQRLSKDEILEIYLNQIFFGNRAYGIKAAARAYYHKELSELTLAEGAMLAGLPKAPSHFSPVSNFKSAKRRQRYVLGQMEKARFITPAARSAAEKEEITVHRASAQNIFHSPYYVSEIRRVFKEQFKNLDVDRDGLQIHTAVDLEADRFAQSAVRTGLRQVDKRRGWRGPIARQEELDPEAYRSGEGGDVPEGLEFDTVYPALVTAINQKTGVAQIVVGAAEGSVNLRKATWAGKYRDPSDDVVRRIRPDRVVEVGAIIEVVLPEPKKGKEPGTVFSLDQTPEVESALVLIDPASGRVRAMIGGYSYQRSQLNRATQARRQPGSSFKPVVYLAATDGYRYTPSTIVHDTPRTFRVGDDLWNPQNFDEKFLGPIPLRLALEKSRNLASADIVSRIGVDAVIQYAVKLGIESSLGRNPSLSLGSSVVTPLEMIRAYGVFANQGVFFDSVFVEKIVDRDGKALFDYESIKLDRAKPVISEASAFVMANLMKGVVQRGTGWRVRALKRPAAGKTGTSNDQMDAWFIGYTPSWVCGVWSGLDNNRSLGKNETGGKVSAPIFLDFMQQFLDYQDRAQYERLVEEAKLEAEQLGIEYVAPDPLEPLDFSVPDGVDPLWVDRHTGAASDPSNPEAIYEYFIRGTEPEPYRDRTDEIDYLDSPEL